MKKIDFSGLEDLNGGCDAGDIFDIGLGIAGLVGIFVAPPTAFFIVPAATGVGLGLGKAISDCI